MTIPKRLLYVFFLLPLPRMGQQDPQFTQYLYNLSIVNPAYTTNEKMLLNFGALYRSQWQNIEGSPTTATFFMHAPLSEKVETGISIVTDDIGDGSLSETNVYADFAYTLPLDQNSRVALGLKAGITSIESNFTNYLLPETQDDPSFYENIQGNYPNFGVGAFYYRNTMYVGLSAPNLLTSNYFSDSDGMLERGSEEIHVFFTGGYVYTIDQNLKLKPSFLAKMVTGAPITLDVSASILVSNTFEAGLSYRIEDAVIGMFRFKITPSLSLGYAYDYTLSNLGSFSAGSHEVIALFNLDILGFKKRMDKSPRFY